MDIAHYLWQLQQYKEYSILFVQAADEELHAHVK